MDLLGITDTVSSWELHSYSGLHNTRWYSKQYTYEISWIAKLHKGPETRLLTAATEWGHVSVSEITWMCECVCVCLCVQKEAQFH
jgi:hypothetical protein